MPWIEPQPSADQLRYWGVRAATETGSFPLQRPGVWPAPNSARKDGRFRMANSVFECSCPYRWWYTYRFSNLEGRPPCAGLPSEISGTGWFDLEVIEGGRVQGGLAPDSNGIEVEFDIRNFDDLPLVDNPGVQQTVTVIRSDGETLVDVWSWPLRPDDFFPQIVDAFDVKKLSYYGINGAIGQRTTSANWCYQTSASFWQAIADCYEFPLVP